MYLYLENGILITLEDIVFIIDYIQLISLENKEFYENLKKEKEFINLTDNIKSAVITNTKVYFTSYGVQTLKTRALEFFNIIGGVKSE